MRFFLRDLKERISLHLEIYCEQCTDRTRTYTRMLRRPLLIMMSIAVLMTIRAARRAIQKTKSHYSSGSTSTFSSWGFGMGASATADIVDMHGMSAKVAESGVLKDYGGLLQFSGAIETVHCFESTSTVEAALKSPGRGKVLVIDGGGSMRASIFDAAMANQAQRSGWKGVILNGCIRNAATIKNVNIGIKALGTHPKKGTGAPGKNGELLTFAGVQFSPGHYVYADGDGVVVSDKPLGGGGGGGSSYGGSSYGAGGYGGSSSYGSAGGYGGSTAGGYGGSSSYGSGSSSYGSSTGGGGYGSSSSGGYGGTSSYGSTSTGGGYGSSTSTGGYGGASTSSYGGTSGYGTTSSTGGYGASSTSGYGTTSSTGGYGGSSTSTGGYGGASTSSYGASTGASSYGGASTSAGGYGGSSSYGASTGGSSYGGGGGSSYGGSSAGGYGGGSSSYGGGGGGMGGGGGGYGDYRRDRRFLRALERISEVDAERVK